jgi:hypothetical protein
VQQITVTSTAVLCQNYSASCVQKKPETKMLIPAGTAATNPEQFQQSAEAACKLLGYATAGSGSIHLTGM